MAKLFMPGYQFSDSNGDPVNGGSVTFYENGTSNPKSVFTDAELTTSASNPATLDSEGRFASGDLYGAGSYTVVLKDTGGTTVWTRDDYVAQDATDGLTFYELGVTAATKSHPGISVGHIISCNYYDSSRVRSSGSRVRCVDTATTTTTGWPNSNGFFYDDDGKKFEIIGEVNVMQFGAKSDSTTDDSPAIQAAITGANGGRVFFPKPTDKSDYYLLGSTVLLDINGTNLIGDGLFTPKLKASHLNGPVIQVTADFCRIENLQIDATSTRTGGAAGSNYGVLQDAGPGGVPTGCVYQQIAIDNQPSHGLVMVGGFLNSDVNTFRIKDNKGHGLVIDDGTVTGRATQDKVRPGGVRVHGGAIRGNFGHAMKVGNTSGTAYRIEIKDIDSFDNANLGSADPGPYVPSTLTLTDHNSWFSIESCIIELCGFYGGDLIGGAYVQGRASIFRNNRYILNYPDAVTIGEPSGFTTEGLIIDEMYVEAPTVNSTQEDLNPAIKILDSGAQNIVARTRLTRGIQNLVTEGEDVEEVFGSFHSLPGEYRAKQFGTGSVITIPDNNWVALEFNGTAWGMLSLAGNVSAAGSAIAHFRVGDNIFCNIQSSDITGSGAAVTGQTGVLSGTTGTDGHLTISAATNDRLYIENRTGASRSYRLTLLSMASGSFQGVASGGLGGS